MLRLLVPLLILGAPTASAQEARVAVVATVDSDPMADRLANELRGVGLTPVLLVQERSGEPELDAIRQQAQAVALFDVVTEETHLTVYVPVPGNVAGVEADLSWPAGDPVAEAMVGVQAVELLRAGLLEAKADMLGRQADRMTLAELALAVGRPGGRRASFLVGNRATIGTFSAGPQSSIALGARIPVTSRFLGTFETAIPYVRARYSAEAGDLFFGTARVELGGSYRLRDPGEGWVPDVGAAVGLTWMAFSYEANPLYLGRDDRRQVRGTLGARGGIHTPRRGPIAGRADLTLDGTPPVRVQLDGVPAGTWGPVQVGLGLGLDVLL